MCDGACRLEALFEAIAGSTSARSSAKPSSQQFLAGNQNDRYNGFYERPDRKSAVPEGKETRVQQIIFG
jgi:hypothetical protein